VPRRPTETNDKAGSEGLDPVGQPNPSAHLPPEEDHLLAKDCVFSFQPTLRLERQGQSGQYNPDQSEHGH
jgi:hypothetical protein